ncbi:MAG TPA: YoaK family protein [Pseudonocardia sp.]|uniref:YoaK family protein n=1 Tax=Pseudonocardia sp. TaxID=60912 RepID=UPI002CDEDBF4|nr:YoaK family protein [Pseudonocardia sp.]HTF53134.1 YoaK family protein [Pseudonocardia sp.]
MPAIRDSRLTGVSAIAVLLAACAGAVDVVSFFGLGNAFAGIVTGNLVTVGYGLATGNAVLITPTVTAVAGCIVGEVIWAGVLNRHANNSRALLIAENILLLVVLITWLANDSHPHGIITLSMIALASVAMGGQSIWALRIHQTTTYFTGMLTTALNSAAGGTPKKMGVSFRQLCALITGAALAGILLKELRFAAPMLPLVLLAAATTIQIWICSPGRMSGTHR